MKTFLLVLIFIIWLFYYFVPYQTKIELFDKAWIDSSFLSGTWKIEDVVVNWGLVELKFDSNNSLVYKWNVSSWELMTDLSWWSLPNVKCFLPKENINFNWKVVLHKIILLKNKNISVKLIKDNKESNLSIYVYKTALDNVLPPKVVYVYECKTDVTASDNKLIEIKWNTAPSEVIIWVSWANGTSEGWYSLELEQK